MIDDDKGLPDGTPDDTLLELSFSFGLFDTEDIFKEEYNKYMYAKASPPVIVTNTELFDLNSVNLTLKFNSQPSDVNSLIYVRPDPFGSNYVAKYLSKSAVSPIPGAEVRHTERPESQIKITKKTQK